MHVTLTSPFGTTERNERLKYIKFKYNRVKT